MNGNVFVVGSNAIECIVLCLALDDWGLDSFIVRSLLLDNATQYVVYTQLVLNLINTKSQTGLRVTLVCLIE